MFMPLSYLCPRGICITYFRWINDLTAGHVRGSNVASVYGLEELLHKLISVSLNVHTVRPPP